MATDLGELQSKLWEAADQLRANSGLKASECAAPVLGLIFLRYADERFAKASATVGAGSARRPTGPGDYQATGALYLPEDSRFDTLLNLSEEADIGKAINKAMGDIEVYNPELQGVLPRDYSRIPDHILTELLRLLRTLPEAIEGDGFGLIYEYFLGNFAFAEGQKGGEFFTPTSIVRLIVEILEPFHGKIYDPACGSGGMFVQSAHFVERHRRDPGEELSIYGQEKTGDTVKLAKMNLSVHGLGGDIKVGNTYYEDLHGTVGKFDFVMANPPFNINKATGAVLGHAPQLPPARQAEHDHAAAATHDAINAITQEIGPHHPSTLPSAAGPDNWISDLEQSPTMLDEPSMLNNLAALRKAEQYAHSTLTTIQTDIDDYNAVSAIGIR